MPWPTPEYAEQLADRLRWERRGTREDHTPDRRDDTTGVRAGSSPHLSDPHLLAPVGPATLEAMRAHRNWALRFAPYLVEDGLDD